MFLALKLHKTYRAASYLCILLLCGLTGWLLVYSLILEAGNIAVSGCKKVGFYNYCLNNKTGTGCFCISQLEDLRKEGVAFPQGLLVPLVMIYSSLIMFLTGTLTLCFSMYFKERFLWLFAFFFNVLSLMGIYLGLLLYLLGTMALIDVSELSSGFLALLGAMLGLALLSYITRREANQVYEKNCSGPQIYSLMI
ncbi:transmembrane protein 140 [Bombina bombina]|uniref:transmembrane protein 140 n=1 Tax=Bombina bombina TaxID=8345 RepID=UPI00235AD0F6|nr:transmembrane protein 140 [Bombina bombina]